MKIKHHITLLPYGGLCNRMMAICSALQLAKATDSYLRIIWERDRGLNCRYNRLFLPIESTNVEVIEASFFDRLRWARPRKPILWISKIPQMLEFDAICNEHLSLKWTREKFDVENWIQPFNKVYIAACSYFYNTTNQDFLWLKIVPEIEELVAKRLSKMLNRGGESSAFIYVAQTIRLL